MIKNTQKTTVLILWAMAFAFLIASSLPLQSQTEPANGETLDLPLVTNVPPSGTFYLLSTLGDKGFGPPFPYNPWADQQPDVFWLGTNFYENAWPNSFIVDDTSVANSTSESQM